MIISFFQIHHAFDSKQFQSSTSSSIQIQFHQIQAFLGIGWMSGCFMLGGVIMRPSIDCQISKPRISQLSLFVIIILNIALPYIVGYYSVSTYAFIYGFFYGGYSLSLKLYVYEIGRPRHFCFLWSIIQLVQGKVCL